jgi:hypothetical protein
MRDAGAVCKQAANLVGSGDSPEVGHVLDGSHRESPVDQSVVDEHVRDTKQCNPQAL